MQTTITFMATLKEANRGELLLISHTDPVLVLTGSSSLRLIIVKLQRVKPSVRI